MRELPLCKSKFLTKKRTFKMKQKSWIIFVLNKKVHGGTAESARKDFH